jgi:hypothetical protein
VAVSVTSWWIQMQAAYKIKAPVSQVV